MFEPVFEELARSKGPWEAPEGRQQVAFATVDLCIEVGSVVVHEYGVSVTPTFDFFLDGKKVRVGAPVLSLCG
jgi:hypothetical protein